MMEKIEVVVVTGMSGAGKTQAMAVFENMEYQCIDNYPVALLGEFGELLRTSRFNFYPMHVYPLERIIIDN